MAKSTKADSQKPTSKPSESVVVAKTDDGSLDITFTIPFDVIAKERKHVEAELAKDVVVPGFRKGKAPLTKALEKIPETDIVEHTLQHILPSLLGKAITEHKLRPAIYPRFELIKAAPNEPWEVRARTAEIPEVVLGDYKKIVKDALSSDAIWTPEKGGEKKEVSRPEKENVIITALLTKIEITIPTLLVEEETNSRLSQLLERIEKLGLTLESYLASVGKKVEDLRADYARQSRDTLALDIILTQIANEEKISISEQEINQAITASGGKPESEHPDRKRIIESVLRKRAALEMLLSL